MLIRLLNDVDPPFGLCADVEIETYSGPGEENGTRTPDGKPTGAVWVKCPRVPKWAAWNTLYRIIQPNEFELITIDAVTH